MAATTDPIPPTARPPGKPWSLVELSAYTSLSERHLRRLIDAGRLKGIHVGRRVIVPDEAVRKLLSEGC